MVQPDLAPSTPKKKKISKNPTPKQQAREKYQKTLNKFKVRNHPHVPYVSPFCHVEESECAVLL
jgi:hypothetical protein